MPFDFEKYDTKCAAMTAHELQHEWEHYSRLISSAATSTSISGVALPFTAGISGIGIALSAPAIHNARKKREIIDKHLTQLGASHNTRKRDVLAPMALSSTIGILTMGVGHASSGAISNAAFEHGWTAVAANEGAVKVTTDLAFHSVAMAGEEEHMKSKKEKEALRRAGVLPPNPSMLDLSRIDSEHDEKVGPSGAIPAAAQAATSLGGKPAMTEMPAMGLSQSVPSTPMDPAPAYTPYAEAAQTGYFPPLPGKTEGVRVTELEHKPRVETAVFVSPPQKLPSIEVAEIDHKDLVEDNLLSPKVSLSSRRSFSDMKAALTSRWSATVAEKPVRQS